MTEEEKRTQRAQLQIQLEDAESDFLHLREKALSMAESIEEVAKKLRDNADLNPSSSDFSMHTDLTNRLRPDQQLDVPAVIALIAELRATRQKVYNLRDRKAQLANPGTWTMAP